MKDEIKKASDLFGRDLDYALPHSKMPKRIDELAAEEKKPGLSDEEWDKIHGKRQDMLHEWERGYGDDAVDSLKPNLSEYEIRANSGRNDADYERSYGPSDDVWDLYDKWGQYAFADQTEENIEKGNAAAADLYERVVRDLTPEKAQEFDDIFGTFKSPDEVVEFIENNVGGRDSDIKEWLESQGIAPDSPIAQGLTPENKRFIRKLLKGRK